MLLLLMLLLRRHALLRVPIGEFHPLLFISTGHVLLVLVGVAGR